METRIGILHVGPQIGFLENYNRLLRKNIDLVKDEQTEVSFCVPKKGFTLYAAQYKFINAINDLETLYGYLEMGKSGRYDAIIPMCVFDPMLREARQALDIPIVAPGEVAMRMAPMMGRKFGVVSIGEKANWTIEDLILKYGVQDHAVRNPVRALPVSMEHQVDALTDARENIKGFIKVSKELIADGAEIIIPGCMIMDPALRMAPGCEKEYPRGLHEVDGVPIMNVIALTIKVAEGFAALKKAGLPWISRKLYYTSPRGDERAMRESIELLKYEGPGFFTA